MACVTLDSAGNITGIYAMPQPQLEGYAVIDDTDPRLAAFNALSPVPQSITPRQFYQQLAVQGVITQAEALAYVQTGAIPPEMTPLIASLPASEQFAATMKICGGSEYLRNDPVTLAIGAAFGWSSTQIDALWAAAAAL